MNRILARTAERLGIRAPAAEIKAQLTHRARQVRRRWQGTDQALFRRYFAGNPRPKLHIGAGKHPLRGWLNTDYHPMPDVAFLDATKPFPFADGVFEMIYSECVIEHVPYENGISMLQECRRVLKPGGVLRLSTPDLAFLVDLHRRPRETVHADYIRYMTDTCVPDAPDYLPGFVINHFDWSHRFIYDEATLRLSLEAAGFEDVVRGRILESVHPDLDQLENTSRMPDGFLALELLIVEATRAPTRGARARAPALSLGSSAFPG